MEKREVLRAQTSLGWALQVKDEEFKRLPALPKSPVKGKVVAV
jgi:hypothetical protein